VPVLWVASSSGLGSCGAARWGSWSRVRPGGLCSAVRARGPVQLSNAFRGQWKWLPTFFCSLTTLVHFFSSSPSYFLRVASSKLGGMLASCRKASAVLEAPMTPR
jgi:hypothetical protein